MGQAVQTAPAEDQFHYERRRPEETTLYQLVQEYVETFFAQVEAETGAGLPDFVKEEFDAWTKLPNGRLISPIHGDMKTGKHITYIKFAPSMETAPHTHSNDYVGIVVKGTARHYQPGFPENETVLPTGSHWAMPADVVHISECLPGSECIFAINQEAAFDIKPVK